jgi:riboflavin synthase
VFSGIVEEVGKVVSVLRKGTVVSFTIDARLTAPGVGPGSSVAVNGACQTVTGAGPGTFSFDSVAETLKRTNLGRLSRGSEVNLESSLRVGDRVEGHFVSGHIDSTCVVRGKRSAGRNNYDFTLALPDNLARYVREKGSICLDGVSLTVKAARGVIVEVTVVPFTLRNTIIRNWRVGTSVNVQVDEVARYLVDNGKRAS